MYRVGPMSPFNQYEFAFMDYQMRAGKKAKPFEQVFPQVAEWMFNDKPNKSQEQIARNSLIALGDAHEHLPEGHWLLEELAKTGDKQ